jgi:hypothetical protein
METSEDFRRGVIDIGKQALELTARENEPFLPKMLVEVEDQLIVMSYPSSFEGLEAVAAFLIDQGKPVTGICLTVDTYHYISPEGEGIEDANRYAGKLQEMFESGHPMVCEALHVTIVTADELYSISLPYARKVKGEVVWRDEIVVSNGPGQGATGRFPELLQAIIAATNMEGNGDD